MWKIIYILLLLTIVALVWVPGASAQNSGQFKVRYDSVTIPNIYTTEALQLISIEPKIFNNTANSLNQLIALPVNVTINLTECGEANAFYDPDEKQILMCYELTDYLVRSFAAQGETAEQSVFDAANTTLFVFFHEMGHGFIDLYKLPVLGRQEDAADGLATWLLLQAGEMGADTALSAANSWIASDTGLNEPSDVHASNQQRYYNVICWIVGSNPQKYLNPSWVQDTANPVPIPNDYRLPQDRAQGCEREYQQLNESWDSLLSPYLLTPESNETTQSPTANITTPTTMPTPDITPTVTVAGNISSCTNISSPGEYILNENITNSPDKTCINISSSNVIFDGANYTITGIGASGTAGVLAYNPAMSLTNITVKNLGIGKWNFGIFYNNVTDGTIDNNIVAANNTVAPFQGIHLTSSSNNTLSSNVIGLSRFGLVLQTSNNNSLFNNIALDNGYGMLLLDSNNSNITGNWAVSNVLGGIGLLNSSNNSIYNNNFNNINNSVFVGTIYSNNWNTTKIAGTNIVNGSNLGGNYWANPDGTGFSQTCQDADGNGICDSAFILPDTPGNSNVDYLPLKLVNTTTNATVNATATVNTTVNVTTPAPTIIT